MDLAYPPGPSSVPPDLTVPTSAYKRHAWLAMLGLAVFIAFYFALSAWFGWTAWRLLGGMFESGGNFGLGSFLAGVCSAFLAIFMLKALFFIQHRYEIEDLEITREDEPQLFEFIDRLADEARAPRAHKVYLSPRVNAAVFYDLSLLNLIIPSKKNLEIGLGLVNVLSLGELKAVLAHEFGHFAQRSMAVSRWVYIAHQIVGHVVARRDALDRLLQKLSRFDLRVAWVGWILSIIVWSIRSMMDVLFRAVVLAQRALSREMEFQADLVAVSLTGSDALVHALHTLNAADDAWDKAMSFAGNEANHKRGIADVFAVHSRIIERMREILNQPTYGVAPPLPAGSPAQHRVFKSQLAQPPQMWSTHPTSTDREHNAKQRYIAAPVDGRSAWALFEDPQALKEKMSAHLFRKSEVEAVPMAKTFEQLDKDYGRAFLDRRYRGIYLGRSPVRYARTAAELYGREVPAADLPRALDLLYPESLSKRIEELNDKLEQKQALEALRDQVARAPGGIIRHNGEELRRSELPDAIAGLEREISEVRNIVQAHDRDCRTAHLSAARTLAKGWPEYLQGLAAALHYADHTEANLRDAQGYLGNIYAVVTADGRVSSRELTRLIGGCEELYASLAAVYEQAAHITLDRTLLRRLESESWPAMLEEFKLGFPTRENISQWFNVVDSWIGASLYALSRLRTAALEQLLLAESQVAKFVREKMPSADAPPPSTLPTEYRTLLPGKERPRQKRLDWWDRFQTADGVVPMLARSVVALGIVGSVIALGGYVGESSLTIYNALARPVVVEVAGQRVTVQPNDPVNVDVPASGTLAVRASTESNTLIESFDEELHGNNAHYVYNVAAATPLYEWTAVYTEGGNAPPEPERPQGAVRWITTHVDHAFEEPPQSIQLKEHSTGYRTVLQAPVGAPPDGLARAIENPQQRTAVIKAHARWDATSSPRILDWLELAKGEADFDALFAARLADAPKDVVLLRFEQDSAGDQHAAVCRRQGAMAAAAPDDADLQYLAIRCMPESAQQGRAFKDAYEKWSRNSWLAFAAGAAYAESGDYARAEKLFKQAYDRLPPVREYLAINRARVRRLGSEAPVDNSDLAGASSQLTALMSIESGEAQPNTPLGGYIALARGDLEAAAKEARAAGADGVRVLRLVGASDGASQSMVQAALSQPVTETADLYSMLAAWGLAAREQRDVKPYVQRASAQLGQYTRPVIVFIETVRAGGDPVAARAQLPQMDLGTRLGVINAVVVMLGPRSPPGWRDEVARGLFVGERQYIGAARAAPQPVMPATRDPEMEKVIERIRKQRLDSKSARIVKSPVE